MIDKPAFHPWREDLHGGFYYGGMMPGRKPENQVHKGRPIVTTKTVGRSLQPSAVIYFSPYGCSVVRPV